MNWIEGARAATRESESSVLSWPLIIFTAKRLTHLFGELDKVLGTPIRPGPAAKDGPDGEREERELKECPPWVVLVGNLDVADENSRAGYPEGAD